jgi:hypothetical protein
MSFSSSAVVDVDTMNSNHYSHRHPLMDQVGHVVVVSVLMMWLRADVEVKWRQTIYDKFDV